MEEPPYGRHLETAKVTIATTKKDISRARKKETNTSMDTQAESTKTVTEVLNLFRATDIAQVVKSLSTEQQDILMKYLYAGMGRPEQYNSSVLLTWHEKVISEV